MGSNIGVFIGVIVLLLSVGFVVLMMVMEWSRPETLGQDPVAAPRTMRPEASRTPAAVRKAAPKAKKKAPSPKKKAAPRPKKK